MSGCCRHSAMPPEPGPWVFVHIPKTGGTALTAWLRAALPAQALRSAAGNILSTEFAASLVLAPPPPLTVAHGHPEPGACRRLRAGFRFVTVLREPKAQIVSHYLHALRDPALPQHNAARGLGFEALLRTYPWLLAFQTLTLFNAFSDPEAELRLALADPHQGSALHPERHYARMLPEVFTLLEEMRLVGTLERLEHFIAEWTKELGLPHAVVTKLNAAPPEQAEQAERCMAAMEKLAREPALAPFFAIEQATYMRARALQEKSLPGSRPGSQPGSLPGPPALAHAGAHGKIWLGENFIRNANGAGWQTAADQRAKLYVQRASDSRRLRLRIATLQALLADEIMLCADDGWLPQTQQNGKDGLELLWPLPGVAKRGRECLTLYVQWKRYPSGPPFYPALHIAAVELTGAA